MFRVKNKRRRSLKIELFALSDCGELINSDLEDAIFEMWRDKPTTRLLDYGQGFEIVYDGDLRDWCLWVQDWVDAYADGVDDAYIGNVTKRREVAENRRAYINGKEVRGCSFRNRFICTIDNREYTVTTTSAVKFAKKCAKNGVDKVITIKAKNGRVISQARWTPDCGGKYVRCKPISD